MKISDIKPEVYDMAKRAEAKLSARFQEIDEVAQANTCKPGPQATATTIWAVKPWIKSMQMFSARRRRLSESSSSTVPTH